MSRRESKKGDQKGLRGELNTSSSPIKKAFKKKALAISLIFSIILFFATNVLALEQLSFEENVRLRFLNSYHRGSPHDMALYLWNKYRERLGFQSKEEFYSWIKENTTRAWEFFNEKGALFLAHVSNIIPPTGTEFHPLWLGITASTMIYYQYFFGEVYGWLHDVNFYDSELTRLALSYAHTRTGTSYAVEAFKKRLILPKIYGEVTDIMVIVEPKFILMENGDIIFYAGGWASPKKEEGGLSALMGGRNLYLFIPKEVGVKYFNNPSGRYKDNTKGSLIHGFLSLHLYNYYPFTKEEEAIFVSVYKEFINDLKEDYGRRGIPLLWTPIPYSPLIKELGIIYEPFPSPIWSLLDIWAEGHSIWDYSGKEVVRNYAKEYLLPYMKKYGMWYHPYQWNGIISFLSNYVSKEEIEEIPKPAIAINGLLKQEEVVINGVVYYKGPMWNLTFEKDLLLSSLPHPIRYSISQPIVYNTTTFTTTIYNTIYNTLTLTTTIHSTITVENTVTQIVPVNPPTPSIAQNQFNFDNNVLMLILVMVGIGIFNMIQNNKKREVKIEIQGVQTLIIKERET